MNLLFTQTYLSQALNLSFTQSLSVTSFEHLVHSNLICLKLWTYCSLKLICLKLWTSFSIKLICLKLWTSCSLKLICLKLWTYCSLKAYLSQALNILFTQSLSVSSFEPIVHSKLICLKLWTSFSLKLICLKLWTYCSLKLICLKPENSCSNKQWRKRLWLSKFWFSRGILKLSWIIFSILSTLDKLQPNIQKHPHTKTAQIL